MANSLEFLIKARDATAQAFHSAKKNMADMADAGGKATGSTERFLKLSPQMMAMGAAVAGVGLVMHDVYKASGDLQKGASSLGDGWSRLMATMADTAMVKAAGGALDWLGGKLTQFSNWLGGKTEWGQQQQLSQREWEKILEDSEKNYKAMLDQEKKFQDDKKKLRDEANKFLLENQKEAQKAFEEEIAQNKKHTKKTELPGMSDQFRVDPSGMDMGSVYEKELSRREDFKNEMARYDKTETEMWADREAEKSRILIDEIENRRRVEDQAAQARLSITASALGSLSALVDGKSKSAFNASKNLAIGETIVSTYAAAQLAYQSQMALVTPDAPARAAAAAGAAVLAGLSRVKAIRSTTYGGGGGGGGSGGGGSNAGGGAGTIPNGIPTGPVQGQQNAQQVLQIQFTGNVYGLKDFEDRVVEAVKNASDKDVVIISNNTAQAREIMRA